MAKRIGSRIEAMPASSPAAFALFLTATLGPMLIFAVIMRVIGS